MGAWIEIEVPIGEVITDGKSLPVWERGLKYYAGSTHRTRPMSLPVWERGLK